MPHVGRGRVVVELVDRGPVLHRVGSPSPDEELVAQQPRIRVRGQFLQHGPERPEDRHPHVRSPPAIEGHSDVEHHEFLAVRVRHPPRRDLSLGNLSHDPLPSAYWIAAVSNTRQCYYPEQGVTRCAWPSCPQRAAFPSRRSSTTCGKDCSRRENGRRGRRRPTAATTCGGCG